MRKILLFFTVCSILHSGYSQSSLNEFTYLVSEGAIPADFNDFLSKKTTDAQTFYLKEWFQSGTILYGTAINRYVNTVADHLLAHDPELRQKIRIYIIKSTDVNAYTTEEGIILVNLGLIAQLTNESELAFILAHEIAHYSEKHIYQLQEYKSNTKSGDLKTSYLSYHNRSRETEMEADRLALERYIVNSPYSYSVLDGVFDILQYDYLPFDELPFEKGYFETEFYQFPDHYFLSGTSPIKSRDDYVDTLSTHPNLKRRRENIKNSTALKKEERKSIFVQPEETFNEIRELARFECINIFITKNKFADAIYNTYLLQKEHPNNKFLDMAMAYSLYGIHKHKMNANFNQVVESYKKIEGEKQQLHHILGKLTRPELNLLALRFLWEAHRQYPEETFLEPLYTDVLDDLISKNRMTLFDFSDYPKNAGRDQILPNTDTADTFVSQPSNKYERIRQTNTGKTQKIVPDEKFKTANYMLVDLKEDSGFVALFEKIVREKEDEKVYAVLKEKEKPLCLDSLLVFHPYFGKSIRKNSSGQIGKKLESYQKEKSNLEKNIQYSLDKLRLKHLFITENDMEQFDTEEYNQFCLLKSWINEFYNTEGTGMILYQSQWIGGLIESTGFDKANLIMVYYRPASFLTFRKLWGLIATTAACPLSFPIYGTAFALPRYETYISFTILDMKTGKIMINSNMKVKSEMKEAFINSFIYDMFYKVKKGK